MKDAPPAAGQSRYRRFLLPHGRLSAVELRYLTEVDHHDHEALVAVDPWIRAGVGIARSARPKNWETFRS